MNKYRKKQKTQTPSFTIIGRKLLIIVVPILLLYVSILPIIISFFFILPFINFVNPMHILFLSLLVILEILLFIISEILVSGIAIRIFGIKYNEGEYDLTLEDKNIFKFNLFYSLYRFPIKLIDTLNISPLKIKFLSLIGLKIGKNSGLGTTSVSIMDPCAIEIGDNTYIGSYSVLTAHVIEKEKLIIKKVKIGNNCLIGGETLLLPGVTIEDKVTVGAKSLVLKNRTLKNGRIYGGVPAKELNPSERLSKQISSDGV